MSEKEIVSENEARYKINPEKELIPDATISVVILLNCTGIF